MPARTASTRSPVTDGGFRSYAGMRVIVPFVAIAAIVACSSASTSLPPADGFVALGTWGGDTAGLIVSDTAMHLHVGCTYGDASGRIPLGIDGKFDVSGNYTLRAFPIAVGPTVPARFIGHVDGAVLTVTATITDTVQKQTVTLGPVLVTYNVEPRMKNCPICRRPVYTKRMSGV